MLYLALILVLAALGLLVAAFLAGTAWAWPSIGLSVLAGLVLLFDWWRGRTADKAAAESAEEDEDVEEEAAAAEGEESDAPAEEAGEAEEEPQEAAVPVAAAASGADVDEDEDLDAEPGEEQTDAADLLIVCELEDSVVVVDEHPRYHLAECGWLSGKDTIPIAVAEARDLGFTPCARCGPDAKLAAKSRKKKRKASWISKD